MNGPLEDAARNACQSIGVDYKPVPPDGRFHLANLSDDPRGRGDGRIKVFLDQQGGIVCNWKTGEQRAFFVNGNNGEPLSDKERERIKAEQQRREREQKARHNRAARRAVSIWQAAKPAPADHPYLVKKAIKPYAARVASWRRTIRLDDGTPKHIVIDDALLIPMFNAAGKLRSLQAIFPAEPPELRRGKDFFPYGELAGLFWWIGKRSNPVLVCEGFATGCTLHAETGHRVYIAFTAGNLLAVGKIVREYLPEADIVFCADNDERTPGNPGVTKATEAAAAVGGSVAIPPIAGDFNDYAAYTREAGS